MATTVNSAFREFENIKDLETARTSRDNLVGYINVFGGDNDFIINVIELYY